ncbi:hypothetical protein diail_6481 [Diaporthe ilicicola]|nr:hypothetical protein diail_6481 [Diaporthe ilicicola]
MAKQWPSLPPAITGLILRHVAQEAATDHTLAQYAVVNKDWQYLFEQLTFRNLSLGPDDLFEFKTTVSIHSERRKWLQSLSFHDCADGGDSERLLLGHDPSQTVFSLLHLLKNWDHDATLRLALYLSAHTTSSLDTRRATTLHENAAVTHSTDKARLVEKDCLGHVIGEIPAVKSFSVQYQGKDLTSTETAISLCSNLPGLEELCLQNLDYRNEHTKHFKIAELTPKLPTTLRRLHILGQGSKSSQSVSACRFLVQRLVWFGITTQLKELSITTSGNAADKFFENISNLTSGSAPISGTLHWPALESLTLTCSLLRPGTSHPAVNRFLHQAGIAALGLPKLRELRLISCSSRRRGEVDGLFRYIIGGEVKAIASCSGKLAKQYNAKACMMSLTGIIASEHIRISRLVMDTWSSVAWKSHQAVLRFSSDVCHQLSLITVESLLRKHGRSKIQSIQYPRPHWTANQGIRDLLGAALFFLALVSFLSLLVRQVSLKEQVAGQDIVHWRR